MQINFLTICSLLALSLTSEAGEGFLESVNKMRATSQQDIKTTENEQVGDKPVIIINNPGTRTIDNEDSIDNSGETVATTPQKKFSPSFNCHYASNNVEKLICSHSELAEIDVKLSDAYLAKERLVNDVRKLKAEQNSWLVNQRNVCKDVACVLNAYNERIATINNLDITNQVKSEEGLANQIVAFAPNSNQVADDGYRDIETSSRNTTLTTQDGSLTEDTKKFGKFQKLLLLLYILAATVIGYTFIRPPLMHWYRTQHFMIFGKGAVDIFFQQIAMRISWEVFIFACSAIIGSCGGSIIYLIIKSTKK